VIIPLPPYYPLLPYRVITIIDEEEGFPLYLVVVELVK